MKSYTLFFNKPSWDARARLVRGGVQSAIDYVAAKNSRPFSGIQPGDEIFVITVQNGLLLVGGRLVANTRPIQKELAMKHLGKSDLIDKDRYVIAHQDELDNFRIGIALSSDEASKLELVSSKGFRNPTVNKNGNIEPMDFYNPTELTKNSATVLRTHLNIGISKSTVTSSPKDFLEGEPDESPEQRIMREILARRGQPIFRGDLLDAYDKTCCITKCKVIELLEAAHIDPYSDGQNNSPTNGLLLRSDIHTLFDRFLLAVDDYGRIHLSKILMNSEYKKLHLEKIAYPRPNAIPSRDALARRYSEFTLRENNL